MLPRSRCRRKTVGFATGSGIGPGGSSGRNVTTFDTAGIGLIVSSALKRSRARGLERWSCYLTMISWCIPCAKCTWPPRMAPLVCDPLAPPMTDHPAPYRLHGVGCDWLRFEQLLDLAEREGADDGRLLLRAALSILRTSPFDSSRPGAFHRTAGLCFDSRMRLKSVRRPDGTKSPAADPALTGPARFGSPPPRRCRRMWSMTVAGVRCLRSACPHPLSDSMRTG